MTLLQKLLDQRASVVRHIAIRAATVLFVISCFASTASAWHGIPSDGKDFYIGYMPGIRHTTSAWSNVFETYFVLVGSYSDGNVVTISYFDQTTGKEYAGPTFVVNKGRTTQQVLDMNHMGPSRPGEVLQYCAAHITSTSPVSVQCYSQGSSAGGMLQAIPTSALGKKYVIASWYDNPIQNNPGFINRDSSSGEFMIIAAYDYTTVTFIPASTTYGGIIGVSSGNGSNGKPHPKTITLNRGQIYWVRSLSVDASFDISGSTVTSNKPIAVLGGHERALLGDPSGIWHALDNDVRNLMINQMTPVEDWESEYFDIPLVPPPAVSRLLVNGTGQMYRVYTNNSPAGNVGAWIGGDSLPNYAALAMYQNPITAFNNVVDPIDLLSDEGAKMYVVEYDYFQGQHDSDPGELTEEGGKNINPQSSGGGGPTVQDETTYKMPCEFNVVPLNRFRKNAVWKVPTQSNYRGYQWINVISRVDSFRTVQMSYNGAAYKPLLSYPKTGPFPIPNRPELTGYQFQLPAGDYAAVSDNAPFVVYSYGRTQTEYKDGWAYASSCGQLYGSGDEPNPPQMLATATCGTWNLKITDSQPTDEGIADVQLLNDPQGIYARPAHTSYNMSLKTLDSNFVVGDSVEHFVLSVNNRSQDAYAAIWAVDRAGNDTLYEFSYTAPKIATTPIQDSLLLSIVGSDSCTSVVLKNKTNLSVTLDSVGFNAKDTTLHLESTIPTLPAVLATGDALIVNVCYHPIDTGIQHSNAITYWANCVGYSVPLLVSGATPIIAATDADFGSVKVGDTVCREVTVKNIGNGPLYLLKNWLLSDAVHFTLKDTASFPITLLPSQSAQLNICYAPTSVEFDSASILWATNLSAPFLHQKKDYSALIGNQPAAAVVGSNPSQLANALALVLNPNPAKTTIALHIEAPTSGIASIGIYDVLGREVKQVLREALIEGSHELGVDIGDLTSGRYFVRLEIGGSVLTKELTIRR